MYIKKLVKSSTGLNGLVYGVPNWTKCLPALQNYIQRLISYSTSDILYPTSNIAISDVQLVSCSQTLISIGVESGYARLMSDIAIPYLIFPM